jgi:hypothetical protein
VVNSLFEENRADLISYSLNLKSGTFLRKLGAEVGKWAFRFIAERPDILTSKFIPTLLCSPSVDFLTSYFDWIDFGMQFPIEKLAELSRKAVVTPLDSILTSNPTTAQD